MANDMYIAWLNDAYALENALAQVLEKQAAQAEDYPTVQAKINEHLEKTRHHAELIKGCIQRNGESVSKAKSAAAGLIGWFTGLSTGPLDDALAKNAIAAFAAENLEIACYLALMEAARDVKDPQTLAICEEILRDEEDMAGWLKRNLLSVVRDTLRREAAVPAVH
jgi:ferritin-like metal-binding protein YciE